MFLTNEGIWRTRFQDNLDFADSFLGNNQQLNQRVDKLDRLIDWKQKLGTEYSNLRSLIRSLLSSLSAWKALKRLHYKVFRKWQNRPSHTALLSKLSLFKPVPIHLHRSTAKSQWANAKWGEVFSRIRKHWFCRDSDIFGNLSVWCCYTSWDQGAGVAWAWI